MTKNTKNGSDLSFLSVCVICVPYCGQCGRPYIYMLSRVLAVVIGIYFPLRECFLPCNGAFIVLSTVGTASVVTVRDIIEGIKWLRCSRQ